MKALIKKNIVVTGRDSESYRKLIASIAGTWVDIETDHLFCDQYNTVPLGDSPGLRLHDSDIAAIRDDARIGKGRCGYCGNLINVSDVMCTRNVECLNYKIQWFDAKSCFFIAHPNGLPRPQTIPNPIKLGTYTLERNHSNEHWILRNMRKRIDFLWDGKYFWVRSLGYHRKKILDVPILGKLILKLNELQPQPA